MRPPHHHAGTIVLGVAVTLFLSASDASAADPLALNEQAVDAMIDGDFDEAIRLLEGSLAERELNVTYLNLGRAYAKAGRCLDALSAYDRMAVASRVDEPPPEALYEILVQYRRDLQVDCTGTIVIRCNRDDLLVSMDGGETMTCPSDGIEVASGAHRVAAHLADGTVVQERVVEVVGMSPAYVDLSDFNEADFSAAPPSDTGGNDALLAIGASALGLGAGMLITAVVVDATMISPEIDQIDAALADGEVAAALELRAAVESEQDVNMALLIAGGSVAALGATGLILALVLDDSDSTAERATLSPTLDVSSQTAVVGFDARF